MNDERRAMRRYYAMQGARWIGLALAFVGLLMLVDRIAAPAPIAYALFLVGLVGFFYLPRQLARRWRSDRE